MKQDIRHSQYILTLGPGAILESINGPRLIPRPDIGLFSSGEGEDIGSLEIRDRRFSALLSAEYPNNGRRVRLFHLPSTSEGNQGLYKTREFPEWRLCTDHGVLFHRSTCCKKCGETSNAYPIRFVMACPKGHMGDVPWEWAVHRATGGHCEKDHHSSYHWSGGGRSFDQIVISCPECGASVTFGELYREFTRCPGIHPETVPLRANLSPNIGACKEKAQIMQRQATNLHMPEIVSLFSVDLTTDLHLLLDDERILASYRTMKRYVPTPSIDQVKGLFEEEIREGKYLNEDELTRVLTSIDNVGPCLEDLLRNQNQAALTDYRSMIQYEFDRLVAARSSESQISITGSRSPSKSVFIVDYEGEGSATVGNSRFRIVPVSRLRTVTVQRGYRRIGANLEKQSELVPVSFPDKKGEIWYPATEFFGEGIFLTFKDMWHDDNRAGPIWKAWLDAYNNPSSAYSGGLFRDKNGSHRDELHPLFIFWHTIAHALLRVLAVDSGYASASIRERVYCDPHNKHSRGGIILYTVQPGEGTMGGLISLVDRFEGLLQRALTMVQTCPNDPLCRDRKFENGMTFGSSCYGCLQASETSCEHRNLWLDRGLLLEYFGLG